jgi:hypothetical protein
MGKNKQTTQQATAQATQGTQQAPATTQGAAPVNAANAVVYKAGKAYNVRNGTAQDNARSWEALQKVLNEKGGAATRADLVAAVTPFNHAPFIGYAIRRGYLVPATSNAA